MLVVALRPHTVTGIIRKILSEAIAIRRLF
jgi:hypothetical protein